MYKRQANNAGRSLVTVASRSNLARAAIARLRGGLSRLRTGLRAVGNAARNAGLALGALAAASLATFSQASGTLGSIQSLGLSPDRVRELQVAMNDLAGTFGVVPDILQRGTYDLISAWGDAEDIVEQLAANTQIAAAGQTDPNTPNTCLLYTSPSPRD